MVVMAGKSERFLVVECLERVQFVVEVGVGAKGLSQRVEVAHDRKLSDLAAEGGGSYVPGVAVDNSVQAANCVRRRKDGREGMEKEHNDAPVVLTLGSGAMDRKANEHQSAAKEKAAGVPARPEAFSFHLVKKHRKTLPLATE